jgi:hypothetical protein
MKRYVSLEMQAQIARAKSTSFSFGLFCGFVLGLVSVVVSLAGYWALS